MIAYMQKELLKQKDLRYSIAERLAAGSRAEALAIRRLVMDKTGVVASTYHRWLLVEKTDKNDIPATVLRLFSELLHVEMEFLFRV